MYDDDENEGIDERLISSCDMCLTDNLPMGTLGRTVHYRCRDCGWGWSAPAPEPVPEPEPEAA